MAMKVQGLGRVSVTLNGGGEFDGLRVGEVRKS